MLVYSNICEKTAFSKWSQKHVILDDMLILMIFTEILTKNNYFKMIVKKRRLFEDFERDLIITSFPLKCWKKKKKWDLKKVLRLECWYFRRYRQKDFFKVISIKILFFSKCYIHIYPAIFAKKRFFQSDLKIRSFWATCWY